MSDSVKAIYENVKSVARDIEREVRGPNVKWESKMPFYQDIGRATWIAQMDDIDKVVYAIFVQKLNLNILNHIRKYHL